MKKNAKTVYKIGGRLSCHEITSASHCNDRCDFVI